jgi:hypothetical protein
MISKISIQNKPYTERDYETKMDVPRGFLLEVEIISDDQSVLTALSVILLKELVTPRRVSDHEVKP